MKINHKLLLGVLAVTVLGTLAYLLYKQNQMRIWTELQPNIQITSDELIKILSSTEYKFENKVEHGAGKLQEAKYGTPEDVWTTELVADQSRFTLTILKYPD